jgi:hypothetical protein
MGTSRPPGENASVGGSRPKDPGSSERSHFLSSSCLRPNWPPVPATRRSAWCVSLEVDQRCNLFLANTVCLQSKRCTRRKIPEKQAFRNGSLQASVPKCCEPCAFSRLETPTDGTRQSSRWKLNLHAGARLRSAGGGRGRSGAATPPRLQQPGPGPDQHKLPEALVQFRRAVAIDPGFIGIPRRNRRILWEKSRRGIGGLLIARA